MSEYDLVGLTETFIPARRDAILATAESHAANQPGAATMHGGVVFDVSHGPPRENVFTKTGGLACLSRMSIVSRHHHIFSEGEGIDGAAAKGVLHCLISRDAGDSEADLIDIFLTHFEDDDSPTKELQIREFTRFVARYIRPDQPSILMGDFNIAGPTQSARVQIPLYRQLRESLDRLGFVDLWPTWREGGGTNAGENSRIDHIWMRGAGLLECDIGTPAGLDVLEMPDTAGVGKDGRLSVHRALRAVVEWGRSESTPAPDSAEQIRASVAVTRLRATSTDALGGQHDFYGSVEFESGVVIVAGVPVITEGSDVEPVNLLDTRRFRPTDSPRAVITIRDKDGPFRGGPDDDVDVNPFDEGTALRIELDLARGYVYSVNEEGNRDLRLGRIGAFITLTGDKGGEAAAMTFRTSATPE